MAGKSNTSATFFAQKKLLGKAHTSNLKTDGEELIGSNIQAASSLIFGQPIPANPAQTLYLLQSASNGAPSTVEYIHFGLTALTGTTYDANETNPDGGSGADSGESSQTSGVHTYKFVFRSDYQSNSSNTKKGNGDFDNSRIVHETLGRVQLVPPFFSQNAPNPYIIKIYKDNGSGGIGDEIPLLDNVDWNVDFYNGILFLQDFNSSKIPAHAKAFAYVGNMLSDVIDNSSGGSGDSGANYLVLAATGSLSNERVLNVSTGLSSSDGGSGGNLTITNTNGNYVFNEFVGFANGVNTKFTLDNTPTQSKNISIFNNGMLQMPATSLTGAPFQDYSVTGSTIFFTSSSLPQSGSIIMANYTTNDAL